MGLTQRDAAASWLLETMEEDRAEAAAHARPEMTAVKLAHLAVVPSNAEEDLGT